jgi:hypothetical protein
VSLEFADWIVVLTVYIPGLASEGRNKGTVDVYVPPDLDTVTSGLPTI